MNIPIWIRSEYVTYIGIALLSFVPSGHDIWRVAPPKMEGKPPGSLTFRNCIIACLLPSHNQFFITWSFLEPFDHPTDAPLYSNAIKTVNLGTYDHNVYTVDDVIKEIFDSVPAGTKETYIYSFTAVYSYRAIVQPFSNHDYASAIVFSYGRPGPLFYRRYNGTDYKYTLQWTVEEI